MDIKTFLRKIRTRVIPNLRYLPQSRFRICGCCLKPTLFVSLSSGDERKLCVRCMANSRYEMLATYLRDSIERLDTLVVVELDHRSPLQACLAGAREYVRTYYSTSALPGSIRSDGSRCEDITNLTFPDESIDVLVSSDVLEHVPDMFSALRETRRVLRPGGFHLFTVPTIDHTIKRAEFRDGKIIHLLPPEYHSDPLDPKGIIAFWNFGMDLGNIFSLPGISISIVAGPAGKDRRVIWKASKHHNF